MDVNVLNLRKPTANQITVNRGQNKDIRRQQKKQTMRDILSRNFFRKYQCPFGTSQEKQITAEKQVSMEFAKLVEQTTDIQAMHLAGYEAELCKDLGLVRKKVTQQTERKAFRASSPMSSLPNLDTEMKMRDQVRLPQLNQARHVSQANLKDMRIQSRYGLSGEASGTKERFIRNHHASVHQDRRAQKIGQIVANSVEIGGDTPMQVYAQGAELRNSLTAKGNVAPLLAKKQYRNNFMPESRMTANNSRLSGATSVSNSRNGNYTKAIQMRDTGFQSGIKMSLAQKQKRSQILGTNTSVKIGDRNTRDGKDQDCHSDISADEWGEIQRYGHQLHLEQQQKEKAQKEGMRKQQRDVLDQQMIDRRSLNAKRLKEKNDMDKQILDLADQQMAEERKKQQTLKHKMLQQKDMRERMIIDANQRKADTDNKAKLEEKEAVQKLQKDYIIEKERLAKQKNIDKAAALKVIKDNEEDRKQRAIANQKFQKVEARAIEDQMKAAERKEQMRLEEIAARDARMQKIMDKMGDQVNNSDKELMKRQERDYIANCIQKDEAAHRQDQNKKLQARKKNQQMCEFLDKQMAERKGAQQAEGDANRGYMAQQMTMAEKQAAKAQTAADKRAQDLQDHQKFLRQQMQERSGVAVQGTKAMQQQKKYNLGGQLNSHEMGMNRNLLKEIAEKKRLDQVSGPSQRKQTQGSYEYDNQDVGAF